jgi:hypothetical protein
MILQIRAPMLRAACTGGAALPDLLKPSRSGRGGRSLKTQRDGIVRNCAFLGGFEK